MITTRLALFLFLQFVLVRYSTSSPNNLSQNQSLRAKQTLISPNGSFELGFFSYGINSYLGIWYGKVLANTIVWVANTETPLLDSSSTLSFTHQGDLALFNANNTVIWSSKNGNTSSSPNPVAELTETGNLVIQNEAGELIWQSFDYLSNTLLPEMKIGKNFKTGRETFLTSWKKNDDPSRGRFELRMDVRGFPQLMLWNRSMPYYRLGSWNGVRFTGTPELSKSNGVCDYEFEMNLNEVYYKCVSSSNIISRLVVNETGFVQRYATSKSSDGWVQIYEAPRDPCDYYNVCGAHATCKIGSGSNGTSCECLKGFVPKFKREWIKSNWSGGCERETPVDCRKKDSKFLVYPGLKLPDTSSSGFNARMSLEECEEMCNGNCSCLAYATSDINEGIGCLLWFDQLVDMRSYDTGGQDIYIRIAIPKQDEMSKTAKVGITVSSVIVLGGILILALIAYVRNNKNAGEKDAMDLPVFGLATILKATDDFSINNKLGQGGFGPVYKGTLTDGEEIAVKKLSKSSGQGATEFKNEVSLIAKLQHRNLVKLLGCCIQGDEKLLIYEYMPNKSLDFFIFDETRCKLLDWSMRLQIIEGIARGLLYLHQDSRCRIIHRDLKASNVLLDKDMNPKISDFGMARMVGVDDTEAYTNRVVGTFGYMSPEYVVEGLFSVKSDVFSYGVLVLEIISGMRNRGFSNPQHSHNLLGHAWRLWIEERPLELTDTTIGDSSVLSSKVVRCIHIALLCLQQRPEDRPSMSVVVQMLGSEDTSSFPDPKQPGFFTERNIPHPESPSTTSTSLSYSKNGCSTISTLVGR